MTIPRKIACHPNFNADDYAYLRAKGWTNTEIATRWNAELAAGHAPCKWENEAARAKLKAVLAS